MIQTRTKQARPYVRDVQTALAPSAIVAWQKVFGRPLWYWTKDQCDRAMRDLDGPREAMPDSEPVPPELEPEPEPDLEPGSPPHRIAAEALHAGNGELTTALTRFVEQIAGQAVNEDRVREIVGQSVGDQNSELAAFIEAKAGELDKAIRDIKELGAKFGPAHFTVSVGNQEPRKIDGTAHAKFGPALKLAMARRQSGQRFNVLLIGPTGCGKSVIGEQIARALGAEYGHLNLSEGISESHLLGRFVPTGDGGRFEYTQTEFARLYENGGVFVLEEFDSSDANVLLAVNNALSNGSMATPNPAKPVVKRHADFVCFACANTWGTGANREYVGRNQLDEATLDRFRASTIEIDYDEKLEAEIGHPKLVKWAQALRAKVRACKIRRPISTRWISDMTALIAQGVHTVESAKTDLLQSWTEDEKVKTNVNC